MADNGITSRFLADSIELGSSTTGNAGDVTLFNGAGRQTIVLDGDDGNAGELSIRNAADTTTVLIKGHRTGGPAAGSGEVVVRNMNGVDSAIMRAVETGGQIDLLNQMGRIGAVIESNDGNLSGQLRLFADADPNATFVARAVGPFGAGFMELRDPGSGDTRVQLAGGDGPLSNYSQLVLFGPTTNDRRMTLESGGPPNNGATIGLWNGSGQPTATLDAGFADDGAKMTLRNGQAENQETIVLNTNLGPGNAEIALHDGTNSALAVVLQSRSERSGAFGGLLEVRTDAGGGGPRIQFFGATGEGVFWGRVSASCFEGPGCDVAEAFDLSEREAVEPGMVMVIDTQEAGHLKLSGNSYDKAVAGIVSGAGDLRPGMTLGMRDDGSNDLPIALSGRVYCYVDASEHAVEVGDLLTTSDTPGYAMKVTDFARSQGAVLGKAMQPLAKGEKGLVLVALQ